MYFIQAITSITHQDSFKKEIDFENLSILGSDSELISPDFKEYIPANSLRRLSPVLRIALTCATECQNQTGEEFDSISVGTSLGCLKDTEKFLQTFLTATSDTLSPTAFIQSTHNTIAGQISLALNNHAYNMTHTQNSLSFEVALIDGILCVNDGKNQVLVGAADEAIDFLEGLRGTVIHSSLPFTTGASFFVIGTNTSEVGVIDCTVSFQYQTTDTEIVAFLQKNNLTIEDIDVVFHSGIAVNNFNKTAINYQDFSGLYYTSSAFGFHLAHDFLKQNQTSKLALLVNAQSEGKLGLTLLGKSNH